MLAIGIGGQSWVEALVRVGVILLATGIILFLIRRVVTTAVKSRFVAAPAELEKRVNMLTDVLFRTAVVLAGVISGLTMLSHAGFDIAPILASVGVAGLAVGLAAQSLIRDTLNGFFVLLEYQYDKGDVVTLAGVHGRVEDVSLRRTLVRDLDGVLHSVPNSLVAVASNHTRQWSRVHLNLNFAVTEDSQRVMGLIDRVGEELASDPAFAPRILAAPRAVWVESLGALGVQVKVLGDTQPGAQWEVASELRVRLQKAFLAEQVQMA
jgi:small conductance mechanosensitive channel